MPSFRFPSSVKISRISENARKNLLAAELSSDEARRNLRAMKRMESVTSCTPKKSIYFNIRYIYILFKCMFFFAHILGAGAGVGGHVQGGAARPALLGPPPGGGAGRLRQRERDAIPTDTLALLIDSNKGRFSA